MSLRSTHAPFEVVPLLVVAGALACATTGVPPAPSQAGCDLGAHLWKASSDGPCASSAWRFSRRPDGRWAGSEVGCANATAIATYDGATFQTEISWPGGAARGSVPLDGTCAGGQGNAEFTAGEFKGKVVSYTMTVAD